MHSHALTELWQPFASPAPSSSSRPSSTQPRAGRSRSTPPPPEHTAKKKKKCPSAGTRGRGRVGCCPLQLRVCEFALRTSHAKNIMDDRHPQRTHQVERKNLRGDRSHAISAGRNARPSRQAEHLWPHVPECPRKSDAEHQADLDCIKVCMCQHMYVCIWRQNVKTQNL